MINPLHPNISMNFLLNCSSYISYDSEKENCTKDRGPLKFVIISLILISEPYVQYNGDRYLSEKLDYSYPQVFKD